MERNTALLEALEPVISLSYDEHMKVGNGTREPIDPMDVLSKAASTSDDLAINDPYDPLEALTRRRRTTESGLLIADPLEYNQILRKGFNDHIKGYDERGIDIRPVLAASFLINLLTEDNLPHYSEKNLNIAGDVESLILWVKEWIAEEASHSLLMRDYALATGIIGPADSKFITHSTYQAGRNKQLRTGTEISPANHEEAFHYLALQELLTRDAHTVLSWLLDSMGIKVMAPIRGDENNHYRFYFKLSGGTLDLEDFLDGSLIAMYRQHKDFDMPGKRGIPRFRSLSYLINQSGVFDDGTVIRAKRTIVEKHNIAYLKPKTGEYLFKVSLQARMPLKCGQTTL